MKITMFYLLQDDYIYIYTHKIYIVLPTYGYPASLYVPRFFVSHLDKIDSFICVYSYSYLTLYLHVQRSIHLTNYTYLSVYSHIHIYIYISSRMSYILYITTLSKKTGAHMKPTFDDSLPQCLVEARFNWP